VRRRDDLQAKRGRQDRKLLEVESALSVDNTTQQPLTQHKQAGSARPVHPLGMGEPQRALQFAPSRAMLGRIGKRPEAGTMFGTEGIPRLRV
jgi:hypothetical protein